LGLELHQTMWGSLTDRIAVVAKAGSDAQTVLSSCSTRMPNCSPNHGTILWLALQRKNGALNATVARSSELVVLWSMCAIAQYAAFSTERLTG